MKLVDADKLCQAIHNYLAVPEASEKAIISFIQDYPAECCMNCQHCQELWWWVWKNNRLDHKEYGHCCTLFLDEKSVSKIDNPISERCEMFEVE